jgi:hypothetical protein
MDSPVDSYYEIKAGSNVTPEQIRATIESGCEDDMLEQLFSKQIDGAKRAGDKMLKENTFKPGDKQYYFPYVQLKSVGKDYIVVDSGLNGVTHKDVKLRFTKDVKMYAKGQAIKTDELVPGKWLTLVLFTTALDRPFATETMPPSELEKLAENGFPRGAQVEGIIQRQFDVKQAMAAMTGMGMEWTRLVKDEQSPDGWRQLIPLDGNWDKYRQ